MSRRTYTVREVHERFGMSPWKIAERCRRGRWPARKVDGQWFIDAKTVEETFGAARTSRTLQPSSQRALEDALARVG